MSLRRRLVLPSLALFVAATASACGGDSAPDNASTEEFCQGQGSLMEDLSANLEEMPEPSEIADSIQAWADDVEVIGTPEDMSEKARAGFEATLEQARGISAEDLEAANLEQLGEELSGQAQEEAEAFNEYVSETCGNLLEDLELPEMPELPQSTE